MWLELESLGVLSDKSLGVLSDRQRCSEEVRGCAAESHGLRLHSSPASHKGRLWQVRKLNLGFLICKMEFKQFPPARIAVQRSQIMP